MQYVTHCTRVESFGTRDIGQGGLNNGEIGASNYEIKKLALVVKADAHC